MRIIYITARNSEEAKKISYALLKKKLAACCNIFPIESIYLWKDEIKEDSEFVILVKTNDETFEKAEKAIKELHSYETPAIYSWTADKVNKDYSRWIEGNTE